MADRILTVIVGGFMLWACLAPGGYAPYALLGSSGGDLLVTLYCGLTYGHLREEGDFKPGRFLANALAFVLLGVLWAADLSFNPGSDAYNNALIVIFLAFWMTFGYRFLQYGLIRLDREFGAVERRRELFLLTRELPEERGRRNAPPPSEGGEEDGKGGRSS